MVRSISRISSRTVATAAAALVALVCLAAPAVSSASVAPVFGVAEPTGTAAGSTASVDVVLATNVTKGDSLQDLTIELAQGLLVNEETDGGACLAAPTPTPACEIGSGTVTLSGVSVPDQLYLVAAPTPTELAGVDLVAGGVTLSGALTLHSSSTIGIDPSFNVTERLTFSNLPTAPTLDALNLTLTGLSMPNSCQGLVVSVIESSLKDPTGVSVSQPFLVSNCLGLPFTPGLQEWISRDTGSTSGDFKVTIVNPAGDSSFGRIKLHLPPNLSISSVQDPCFEGLVCNVGTFSAVSPIMPANQLTGPMVLSGTLRAPSLTISLQQPSSIQFGAILSATQLTLSQLPDMPWTNVTLSFTGDALGGMFDILCYPVVYGGDFLPTSGGNAAEASASNPITVGNCKMPTAPARVGKPTAHASVSGAASGSPSLAIKALRGKFAANIASLSITLPAGFTFAAGMQLQKLVSLTGATIASARIQHGTLVVRFKHASGKSTLTVHSPLLVESAELHHAAQGHDARAKPLAMTVIDNAGHRTKLSVAVAID